MTTTSSDTSTTVGQCIKSIIERVERVEAEIKDRQDDRKEIYAEAKGDGLDVPVIKAFVAIRKKDPNKVAEFDAVFEMYEAAMGGA